MISTSALGGLSLSSVWSRQLWLCVVNTEVLVGVGLKWVATLLWSHAYLVVY